MAALTKGKVLHFEAGVEPVFNDLPVEAATQIWQGAALTWVSGYVRPGVSTHVVFAGFAEEDMLNSGAAGAKTVRTRSRGVVKLAVTGVVATTALGTPVYVTDDQTFTLTDSTGAAMGKVHRYLSDGNAMVYFEGSGLRFGIAATEV